ncbi:MAG: AIR synthase-related protein, partial [Candidatus Bathyarchaeia archaeon]
AGVGILIYEDRIRIRGSVRAACDMLGLDPLEIGNEGKVIIGVVREKAEDVLDFLRGTSEGRDAEIIGEVSDKFSGVVMETIIGGKRIIPRPIGDPIPRIC